MSVLVRAAYPLTLEAFLETWHYTIHYLLACSLSTCLTLCMRISLHTCYTQATPNPLRTSASLICHSFTEFAGAGISTCCPSTTPVGLALGPDLPRADEPSPGNLGLSVCRILTYISLLTPAFSLICAPTLLTVRLQRCIERSPTTYVET